MFTSNDDVFLTLAARKSAEEALRNLRSSTSSTQALHISIEVEDTINRLLSNSVITKAQAKRLYLVFEGALEIMLRDLAGKGDEAWQFP
jgi:hypothetical protein